MAESDLSSYQLQLQQVEAALTADPDNQELLKLKGDLEEVINLTKDLISAQLSQGEPSGASTSSSSSYQQQSEDFHQESSSSSTKSESRKLVENITPLKHWQVGEHAQALWQKDGMYYEATINEITTDGEVSVTFRHNGKSGITSLGLLKFSKLGAQGATAAGNKKEQIAKQREYLKKKKLKKQERWAEMEKAREKDQNKWKNFSNKAFGKKGFVKKSIFKTPENASGRVGVGTCGIGGKNMTTQQSNASHKKQY